MLVVVCEVVVAYNQGIVVDCIVVPLVFVEEVCAGYCALVSNLAWAPWGYRYSSHRYSYPLGSVVCVVCLVVVVVVGVLVVVVVGLFLVWVLVLVVGVVTFVNQEMVVVGGVEVGQASFGFVGGYW